jgi:hypothetical protein
MTSPVFMENGAAADKAGRMSFMIPVKVSENVQLGPQLSLKRIDLKDGTNALADTEIKELTPYFGLWLYF